MYNRWIFTLDLDRFPVDKMQTIVNALHANKQHYIMMIDPAIAYQPYPSFQRAVDMNVLLKEANGEIHKGVVWAGVTAFPDCTLLSLSLAEQIYDIDKGFHPNATEWYNGEFKLFFDPETGVDIDGSWIDMNGS